MARTVFLSSAYRELIDYRQAGREAIQDAGCALAGMEATFVAVDLPAEINDEEQVKRCDIFVLLLGHRCGSLSIDGVTSFTELEYKAAVAAGKVILVFRLSDTALSRPASREEEQEGSLDVKRDSRDKFYARVFKESRNSIPVEDPQNFRYKLRPALDRLNAERSAEPVPMPKPKINRMLAKICDRCDQFQDFSLSLNLPERYVHIHVVYGKDQQQHQSCVERLICRKILNQHPDSENEVIAPGHDDHRVIVWPAAGSNPGIVVLGRLQRALCLAIDPKYTPAKKDFDAQEFVELAAVRRVPYLVFRHGLAAAALPK